MSGVVQTRPASKADAGVDGTNALRSAARCGQAPEPRSGAPQGAGLEGSAPGRAKLARAIVAL